MLILEASNTEAHDDPIRQSRFIPVSALTGDRFVRESGRPIKEAGRKYRVKNSIHNKEAKKPMKPRNEPDASSHGWNTDKTQMGIKPRKRRNGVKGDRSPSASGRLCDAGKEAGAPSESVETGGDGKRRLGMRGFTGLSGLEMGKCTGFSHFETALTRLFPHDSTQVVDFPHLAMVSIFWGGHEIAFSGPKREVMI